MPPIIAVRRGHIALPPIKSAWPPLSVLVEAIGWAVWPQPEHGCRNLLLQTWFHSFFDFSQIQISVLYGARTVCCSHQVLSINTLQKCKWRLTNDYGQKCKQNQLSNQLNTYIFLSIFHEFNMYNNLFYLAWFSNYRFRLLVQDFFLQIYRTDMSLLLNQQY